MMPREVSNLPPAPHAGRNSPSARSTLPAAVLFLGMGLVALGCGGFLVVDGLGMPESTLDHTPFDSFFWPGIILAVIVGGSQLLAARALWFRQEWATGAALVAAIILLGWIVIEAIMVRDGRLLQLGIAGYAVLELWLVSRLIRQEAERS